jgi:hypothetical protein
MKKKTKIARKDTVVANRAIYVKICDRRRPAPKGKRTAKGNPTPTEVARHNEHVAIRGLSIKLDANFLPGDYHLVLTYAGAPPTPEEAKRHIENFSRRIARKYKKMGVLCKWICTTEYMHGRIHHHFILTAGVPLGEIAAVWGYGRIRNSFLYGESFWKLARYIIKETRKTFSEPEAAFKRRYSCSRSVCTPEVRTEYVIMPDLEDDPKPLRGYSVDPDTIYRGMNPLTGRRDMESTMIAITDEPRIKRWRRGRIVKPREPGAGWYKRHAPRQEGMWSRWEDTSRK